MRTWLKKLALLGLILGMIFSLLACTEKIEPAGKNDASTDGQEIIISGLSADESKITVAELKKLPAVSKRAEASRANGESVKLKATGPLLEKLLEEKGKSINDYSRIRLTARDGYSIAVPADIIKNRPIILAYEIDGKAPDAENQPIRVVIPGERAMYWVRMLARIDLESGAGQMPVKRIVFLETAFKNLPQEDYEHFDSIDKAIKTKDLIEKYADNAKVDNVFIKASDGLQKNESKANFLSAYIKITGKEAPKFLAPHLPQGMHIRELFCINYGETSFLAYSQGEKLLPAKTIDEQSGIALSDIIKQIGLVRAAKYQFKGLDGQNLELAADELGSGLICKNDQGILIFCCPGAANKRVENLLSIECRK